MLPARVLEKGEGKESGWQQSNLQADGHVLHEKYTFG